MMTNPRHALIVAPPNGKLSKKGKAGYPFLRKTVSKGCKLDGRGKPPTRDLRGQRDRSQPRHLRNGDQRMLGRWLIAILLTVLALVVIDRVSLVIAPCSEYSDARNNHDGSYNKECSAREGLIIAGIKWLADIKSESWTALATVAIAAFTLTLWLSSEKMWRVTRISTAAARRSVNIARRQIELARQEFLSTHRPKIRIKSVSLMNQIVGYDEPIIIRVNCVNNGATDAVLVTYGISVMVIIREVSLPPIGKFQTLPFAPRFQMESLFDSPILLTPSQSMKKTA
jgi:hypothetical protein